MAKISNTLNGISQKSNMNFDSYMLNEVSCRNIGLVNKNYNFLLDTLSKNIGNGAFDFDGFGTPIGDVSDQFFNLDSIPFYATNDRNRYATYLDYVKSVGGTDLTINSFHTNDNRINILDPNVGVMYFDDEQPMSQTYSGLLNFDLSRDVFLKTREFNTNKPQNTITEGMNAFYGNNDLYSSVLLAGVKDKGSRNSFLYNEEGRIMPYPFSTFEYLNRNMLRYAGIDEEISYSDLPTSLLQTSYRQLNLYDFREFQDNPIRSYFTRVRLNIGSIDNIFGKLPLLTSRYIFDTDALGNTMNEKTKLTYAEYENGRHDINAQSFGPGTMSRNYSSYADNISMESILGKTNAAFRNGRIETLIARFHTPSYEGDKSNPTQTAVSSTYGMSHGRNLLKLTPDAPNGYDNPYCRVWTYHHQYSTYKDVIRPFTRGDSYDQEFIRTFEENEDTWSAFSSRNRILNADNSVSGEMSDFPNGRKRLRKYGTKNKDTGLINITPTSSGDISKKVDIKQCMFSIENLAWKDMFSNRKGMEEFGLSEEQKGPFGGRIMWFPPYDIKFNETTSAQWESTNFIGRGEPIFTYTNTTRSGNLSFKMLIDHPSIIDYWDKRKIKDNLDDGEDVDKKDGNEQTILRFFAGCGTILTPTPYDSQLVNKYVGASVKNDAENVNGNTGIGISDKNPTAPNGENKDDVSNGVNYNEPDSVPLDDKFEFFVFFPNNYSGKDDINSNIVNPIEYLLNGIGTQKAYTRNTDEIVVGQNLSNSFVGTDIPTDMNEEYVFKKDGRRFVTHGYEVTDNADYGISTVNSSDDKSGETGNKEGKWGNNCFKIVNGLKGTYYLAKQFSDSKDREWYYRVDKRTAIEKLHEKQNNYTDNKSFGLNSAIGQNEVKSCYYKNENSDKLYSLVEVYMAFHPEYKAIEGTYRIEKVNELRNILSSYTIKSVKPMGYASEHGYHISNDKLQEDRAETIANWIRKEFNRIGITNVTKEDYVNGGEITVNKSISVNSLDAKIGRSAKLVVNFTKTDMNNLKDTQENSDIQMVNHRGTYNGSNNSASMRATTLTEIASKLDSYEGIEFNSNLTSNSEFLNKIGKKSPYLTQETNRKRNNIVNSRNVNNNSVQADERISVRYDCEGEFFERLSTESPLMRNKISEKIKYFDPAFHSISPEGFNARLTFLEQCMRQGPTVSNMDLYQHGVKTADNLAFGRAPVCILRLGDFYYTKIIIKSIQKNYEPLVWDLNDEGIGVMPMIADINIGFEFIGGNDLEGPISRLQNAVSFNYYANTGVYDNRSEMVHYNEENGDVSNYKPFNPRIKNNKNK